MRRIASIASAAALVVALAGCQAGDYTFSGSGHVNVPSDSATASAQASAQAPAQTAAPVQQPQQAQPAPQQQSSDDTSGSVDEISDNHGGVQLFGGADGSSVRQTGDALQYGEHVPVDCYTENNTGEYGSIAIFYHISGGPHKGTWASGDTFANGGSMGMNGINFDPRLKDRHC